MTPLKTHIKQTYGSVYAAAKATGRTETQLHNWIKRGDCIDKDGQVWIKSKGRLPVDELHAGAVDDIDTTKR